MDTVGPEPDHWVNPEWQPIPLQHRLCGSSAIWMAPGERIDRSGICDMACSSEGYHKVFGLSAVFIP